VAEGWAALSLLKLDLSVELPAMARKALELQWAQRLAEAMAPEVIQGATPEETA
jgi:hypothetical protein